MNLYERVLLNSRIKWSYCKKHQKPYVLLCMKCFIDSEKGVMDSGVQRRKEEGRQEREVSDE